MADGDTNRIIEIVLGALALVGAAVSAVWYAGRSLGRLDTTVTQTVESVQDMRKHDEIEHAAIAKDVAIIHVKLDDQGRVLVQVATDQRSIEQRMVILERIGEKK